MPVRRDLLDLTIPEIARMALIVVEAEGPVHSEEVARRIREAFGLQKTGRRILDHVRSGLQHLLRNANVTHDGEFSLAIGHDLQFIRRRRNAALSLRRASMNSIRVSIRHIDNCFGGSRDHARRFGRRNRAFVWI